MSGTGAAPMAPAGALVAVGLAEFEVERDRELAAALARNARLLELARHNGFECEVSEQDYGRAWRVPLDLIAIAGAQILILPPTSEPSL